MTLSNSFSYIRGLKFRIMKELKKSFEEIDSRLTDGECLDDILGSNYDLLRVDELGRSYERNEEGILNQDVQSYREALNAAESKRMFNE